MSDRLCLLTATAQSRLLRSGEISARELMAAHLEQIDRVNPAVNAVVTRVDERALKAADAADLRRSRGERLPALHGLPIAHKDLVDTAGVRTTYGSPSFADHVPRTDALVSQRLREAGAIMLGKTNTPEFGAGSHTFNPVFGATRNPWATDRSAGGSSGGAAAALACRMVPLADGSDLGGSLRNPAAWNNVYGLRPTPGRVPSWPNSAPWMPFAVEGPMARTAVDTALLLSAMSGPDPRAPLSGGIPQFSLPATLEADLSGRRVAWSPTLGGLPIEADVLAVLEPAIETVAGLGPTVEAAEPDLSGADVVFETWRAYLMALGLGDLMAADGDRMKETLRWNIRRGLELTAADLMAADRAQVQLHTHVRAFFEDYDHLACPVTQLSPFALESEYPAEVAGVQMGTYLEWMRACSRITATCYPAVSIPIGFTAAGLPVGLQLVGRPFAELALLELAHALEGAVGVVETLPPAVV